MRTRFMATIVVSSGLWLGLPFTTAAAQTAATATQAAGEQTEYLLLATNKTSTAQEEMAEAADQGYRFAQVMGGDTAWGGSEVVVIMSRTSATAVPGRFEYRLLATSRTSAMQRELQEASDAGFQVRRPDRLLHHLRAATKSWSSWSVTAASSRPVTSTGSSPPRAHPRCRMN